MARIAENQTHDLTLTMPFDLTGKTLEAVYVDQSDTVTAGATASGKAQGKDVTISTDLAAKGISPGLYTIEVRYDDSGTTRELKVEDDTLIVNDAVSV